MTPSEVDPPTSSPRGYSAAMETAITHSQDDRMDNSCSNSREGKALSHVCGAGGVLCNPAEILSNIFPFHEGDEDPPSLIPADSSAVQSGVKNDNVTPPTSPIRRGRFLVWPVSLGGPLVATSASSSPGYQN